MASTKPETLSQIHIYIDNKIIKGKFNQEAAIISVGILSHPHPEQLCSIGASAPASVLPMSIQDWLPLELTGPKDRASGTWNLPYLSQWMFNHYKSIMNIFQYEIKVDLSHFLCIIRYIRKFKGCNY